MINSILFVIPISVARQIAGSRAEHSCPDTEKNNIKSLTQNTVPALLRSALLYCCLSGRDIRDCLLHGKIALETLLEWVTSNESHNIDLISSNVMAILNQQSSFSSL